MSFSRSLGGAEIPQVKGRHWSARGWVARRRRTSRTRVLAYTRDYATLGLTPFASRADVKNAYKRLVLKYHPDVSKGETEGAFMEIKSAYESLMAKIEEEEIPAHVLQGYDEWDDWEEWMGFEGGMPIVYPQS